MREKLKRIFFQAEDFMTEGSWQLAVTTYLSALKEAKKGDLEEIQALNFLGMIHNDMEDKKNAIKYFQKAQQVAKKRFTEDSIPFAVMVGNEGMVYSHSNELWLAEPLLDKAVKILANRNPFDTSQLEGFETAQQVVIYNNAGDCKARLGKLDDAIELFNRGHKIAQKSLPRTHQNRIEIAMALGILLSIVGKEAESAQLQEIIIDDVTSTFMHPMDLATLMGTATAKCGAMVSALEKRLPRQLNHVKPAKTMKGTAKKQGGRQVSNVISIFPENKKTEYDDETENGYQFLITLKHVSPPIWRRLIVPADFTLSRFHSFIQKAMGWSNSHLHAFRVAKLTYGNPEQVDGAKNERNFTLRKLNLSIGSKFTYEYDFGDFWEHSIVLEKILDADELDASDFFIAAQGACPPEDCGGPPGFMNMLDALKKPQSNINNLEPWVRDFDPDRVPFLFAQPDTQQIKEVKTKTKTNTKTNTATKKRLTKYSATKTSSKSEKE